MLATVPMPCVRAVQMRKGSRQVLMCAAQQGPTAAVRPNVVITGASTGIGRATAILMANKVSGADIMHALLFRLSSMRTGTG